MTDDELERYARHIILREIGGPGQSKLRKARVLSIGAGGLGSPLLMYLAAAGVGTLGIIDDDHVSLSNLQRQILFSTDSVGEAKTEAAARMLTALNDGVTVETHLMRIDASNADEIIGRYDVVCDGSDNFSTRYLINEACVRLGVPLIAGAIGQWDAQLSVYDSANETPCYACIFPDQPEDGTTATCAEAGVVGALPGIVGSVMAMETIKHITGAGETLAGQLWLYDALSAETRVLKVSRQSDCKVCGVTSRS
ncbi:UNVERIFIED_CONTAM: hypothetical protein GTU68_023360 [Idotea baltica]|nr:hypothetical protein [Idotea baltica]